MVLTKFHYLGCVVVPVFGFVRGSCWSTLFLSVLLTVTIKVKFHYAIWLQTGPKLVADLQRAEIWPIIYLAIAAN